MAEIETKRFYQPRKKRRAFLVIAAVLLTAALGMALYLKMQSGRAKKFHSALSEKVATPPLSTSRIQQGTTGSVSAGMPSLELPNNQTVPSAKKEESEQLEIESPELTQARLYFMAGDFRSALPLYEKAATSDPRYLTSLAICHYQLGKYSSAAECFARALAFREQDFLAHKYMSLIAYRLNQLEQCRQHAEEALQLLEDKELRALLENVKKELAATRGFSERESEHFRISFSQSEHVFIKGACLDILKQAYRSIGKRLDIYPELPTQVILYNETTFFDITHAPQWSGGLFDGKIRVPIHGFKESDMTTLQHVLFHEYTHALIYSLTTQCPVWLHEGLAEYFSEADLEPEGQVIPLATLEHGFPGSAEMAYVAYRESCTATSYLVDRYGAFRLKDLLQFLAEGADIDTAFHKAFGKSYQEFLASWGRENSEQQAADRQ